MSVSEVTIIIPVIRPDKAQRCLDSIYRNSGVWRYQYNVITEEDKDHIGAPLMVKNLVEKADSELVMFLGDDTIPQPAFLFNALKCMKYFREGWGLVGLNDGFFAENGTATHWLAHKKLLEILDGEFFHTGYRHCFCDVELTERCREINRYIWCEEAKIIHDHPMLKNKTLAGTDYEKPYLRNNYYHDLRLFKRRKANGWKSV
jgi:hypothetical protein